jgi:hypothetical protein
VNVISVLYKLIKREHQNIPPLFFTLPDTSTITSRIIVTKDREELTLTNSNLSEERHQVVGDTSGVLTQDTGRMGTGRVEVTK